MPHLSSAKQAVVVESNSKEVPFHASWYLPMVDP
jgi:hypothetical protein